MIGLEHNAWVLVCDGRKALLLQNKGDAIHPRLETRAELSHDVPPSHELGTDAPGRTFSSAGSGHSAIEPTDLHALEEERFVKRVAARINRDAYDKHVANLIVVAPARALAVLRREWSPAAQAIIAVEFDKDLVKEPVPALEKHLKKMLAPQP